MVSKILKILKLPTELLHRKKPVRAGADSLNLIQGLVDSDRLRIDWRDPAVKFEYFLYDELYGNRATVEADRKRFLSLMRMCRTYINVQRAAFNGAASEGYEIGPNGEMRYNPLNPDQPMKYQVMYPGSWDNALLIGCVSDDNVLFIQVTED